MALLQAPSLSTRWHITVGSTGYRSCFHPYENLHYSIAVLYTNNLGQVHTDPVKEILTSVR